MDSDLNEPEDEAIQQAVHQSTAAEFTTAKNEKPVTFPLTPYYDSDREKYIVTSPPAFSDKLDRIRENPRCSFRFYQQDEPLVVRGKAEIREDLDPEQASNYLTKLAMKQPASTEKSQVFIAAANSMNTRWGRYMKDWYRLRLIVEFEPESMYRDQIEDRQIEIPVWSEIGMDQGEATKYSYNGLGYIDTEGYPVSCGLQKIDIEKEGASITSYRDIEIEDGMPACLLLHWHSTDLQDLGQRLIRGRLYRDGEEISFKPGSSFTLRDETRLDDLIFNLRGKWRTARYFGERNPLNWRW